jgi:hypothetical protein
MFLFVLYLRQCQFFFPFLYPYVQIFSLRVKNLMRNMVAELRPRLLGILELKIRVDRNRDNTKWPAGVGAFSRGLSTTMRLRNRSGLRSQRSNEQSHDRGHRDALRSPRATSNWDGVRRATLTHGFGLNTNGSPAYSFPSDSAPSLPATDLRAKLECFLRHGSSPPRRGWCANKSLI